MFSLRKILHGNILILAAFLLITGCPNTTDPDPGPADSFVAVTDITGVQTGGFTETAVDLGAAAITPDDASNTTIEWTVKEADTTGVSNAGIVNNKFTPAAAGTLTLTATIANGTAQGTPFAKDFTIRISQKGAFVPVADITGVPDSGFVSAPVSLGGATVVPDNANNKTIVWSVKTEGAGVTSITGNSFTPSAAGSLTLTATIANGKTESENYTQDFTIAISEEGTFVAVTGITGVPGEGVVGSPVSLAGATVVPSTATNKTISWVVKTAGAGVASITGNSFTPTETGTVTLTARILSGAGVNQPYISPDFDIVIKPAFVAVTGINGLPVTRNAVTGGAIDLTAGTSVIPAAATNRDIVWSIVSAGNTGLTDEDVETGTFTPEKAGTVTLTATIFNGIAQGSNYTQHLTLTIIKPVSSINGVPEEGTMGHEVDLSGASVEPSDATNKTIEWTIKSAGTTGVTGIADKKFTPTAEGTLVLTATIADGSAVGTPFTDDYTITIYKLGEFKPEFGFGEDTSILLRGSAAGQELLSKDTAIEIAKDSVYYVSLITGGGGSYSDVVWYLNSTKQTIGGSGSLIYLDTSAARTIKLAVIAKRGGLVEGSGLYTFKIVDGE
jgi:endo-1,4-beta-xylanase